MRELFGVDPSKVHTNGPDWLEQLADFLTHPLTRFFLVMIGIVCLILELKLSEEEKKDLVAFMRCL